MRVLGGGELKSKGENEKHIGETKGKKHNFPDAKKRQTRNLWAMCVRFTGGPVGGAAVSWPKGCGFDSHLTGFAGHASKPMEHGCGNSNRGSSSLDTLVMLSGAIS